jgi:large subunit ribosomal protein L9
MKVILTQEIKGCGGEGDVIEVKRGFAVNYLFPKKLAIQATAGELKQLELRRHNIEKREVARMDDANQAVDYLSGKIVGIPMKVGEEGRLFGSVTAHMIADALHEQHGLDIDRRKIEVKAPIKELGDHLVDINVYRELKAPITVRVVPDGEAIDTGLTAEEAAEFVEPDEADVAVSVETPVVDEVTDTFDVGDMKMPVDSADVDYDAVVPAAAPAGDDVEWTAFEEGGTAMADETPIADERVETPLSEELYGDPKPGQEDLLEEGVPNVDTLTEEAAGVE